MADEHSCYGMNSEITFHREGLVIQRWIRLCDNIGTYWGGWALSSEVQGMHHMTVNEHWMFRQIAQFAHESGTYYTLCGHGYTTAISTRMEADRIAGAFTVMGRSAGVRGRAAGGLTWIRSSPNARSTRLHRRATGVVTILTIGRSGKPGSVASAASCGSNIR